MEEASTHYVLGDEDKQYSIYIKKGRKCYKYPSRWRKRQKRKKRERYKVEQEEEAL